MKNKNQTNFPVDFPSNKSCPILSKLEKDKKKKLFEISFEICNDLTDVFKAYTKKEAKEKFLKQNGSSLDKEIKDSIKVKEINKKEFEERYFRK